MMSSLIVILGIIKVDHEVGVLAMVDVDCNETSLDICIIIFTDAVLDFCHEGAYRC